MSDYKVELLDELGNRQFPITLTSCVADKDGVSLNTLLNEKSRKIHLKVYTVNFLDLIDENGEILENIPEWLQTDINNFYTPEVQAHNNSYFRNEIFDLDALKNDIIICNDAFVTFGGETGYLAHPISNEFSIENDVAIFSELGYIEEIGQPILIYMPAHLPAELLFSNIQGDILESILLALLIAIFSAVDISFYFETYWNDNTVDDDLDDIDKIVPEFFNSILNISHPFTGTLLDTSMSVLEMYTLWLGDIDTGVVTGTLYIDRGGWHYYPRNMYKYKQIHEASVCGALIPGNEYRITDYQTIVDPDYGVQSDENNGFELIVKAKDYFTLEEEAIVRKAYPTDIFSISNIFNSQLEKVKYSLENTKFMYPWVVEDSYIEFEEDLHAIRFYKTHMCILNNEGNPCYIWRGWHPENDWVSKLFTSIALPENIQVGGKYIEPLDNTELTIKNIVIQDHPSKGFIYEMTDRYGNQAPWDFYNLRFKVYKNNSGQVSFNPFPEETPQNILMLPTFYSADLERLTGDGNLVVEHGLVLSSNYSTFVACNNNKITGKSYRRPNILRDLSKNDLKVIIMPRLVSKDENNYTTFHLENTTVESCGVIAMLPSNSTIGKGCEGLSLMSSSNTLIPILNVLPGTNLEVDYTNKNTNVLYIGKNSNGQIKMWNPADLIN